MIGWLRVSLAALVALLSLCAGLSAPARAYSMIVQNPSTDCSTTQTTGGTAQALCSGAVPAHGFKVYTPGTTQCYLSDTTTTPSATTPGSYPLYPNSQYATEPGQQPIGPVYINCPMTGQVISAQEW